MTIDLWVSILTNVGCTIIGGLIGFFTKTIMIKNTDKKSLKQKAGKESIQIQIGGDVNAK